MLKLQYSGHLIQTVDSLEKTLMLELLQAGGEGDEGMRTLHGITDSMDMSLSKLWETVKDREGLVFCSSWGCSQTGLSD